MKRTRTPKWLRAAREKGPVSFRPGEKPDWVTRALARAGVLPPDEAEKAVRAGRVTIAGRQTREPLSLVREGDEVRLDGRKLDLRAATIALAFHKPAGCVVSTVDPKNRPTVFALLQAALPPELRRYVWHAIGRLDVDTTGLLLFTNDERLVSHATRPETHLPKRYLAEVQGHLTDEKLEPLRRGVELDDGPARPAQARVRGPGLVELTLTEGRNHQVKRMLGAVGLPVRRLHREAIGDLELDVPEGGWRKLATEETISKLGFSVG